MRSKHAFRNLIIQSAKNWSEDGASRLAAAISFYAVLSLAPLLVFAVVVIGRIYGSEGFAKQRLLHIARENMGPGASDFLETLLKNAHQSGISTLAGFLSVIVALFGASSLFGQLTDSLNTIWGVAAPKGSVIVNFFVSKALSVLMVLVFAIVVLAWVILDSVVGAAAIHAGAFSGWPYISLLISSLFLTGVFALTFKALPHGLVAWKDVRISAIVTALGFSLAKFALSLYFTYADVQSAYGPAGALVLILLWIYYSAQVFFYGAEMTCVYAHTHGSQKGRTMPGNRYS